MTEDHYPPESQHLPGDHDLYPEYCTECEQHVLSDHDHDEDCSEWRGNDAPST